MSESAGFLSVIPRTNKEFTNNLELSAVPLRRDGMHCLYMYSLSICQLASSSFLCTNPVMSKDQKKKVSTVGEIKRLDNATKSFTALCLLYAIPKKCLQPL